MTTVEGGIYLSQDGKTYQDANGNPVAAPATTQNATEGSTSSPTGPPVDPNDPNVRDLRAKMSADAIARVEQERIQRAREASGQLPRAGTSALIAETERRAKQKG